MLNEKRSKKSYKNKWVKGEQIHFARSPQPFLLMCAPWVWASNNGIRYLCWRDPNILKDPLISDVPDGPNRAVKDSIVNRFLCLIAVQSLTWVKEFHDTRTRSVSQSKSFENPRVYTLDKLTTNKKLIHWCDFFVAKRAHLIRNFYSSQPLGWWVCEINPIY